MKERGVIMRDWEVQATQEGRKTVFRRTVKHTVSDIYRYGNPTGKTATIYELKKHEDKKPIYLTDLDSSIYNLTEFCPFGQIGGKIYVRETWLQKGEWHGDHWDGWGKHAIAYFADGWPKQKAGETKYRKRPSIHMPKKYARIWLEITNIRVERVQDISNDQSGEEGMTYLYDYYRSKIGDFDETLSDRDLFEITWDSVYNNWNDNPWVWVIEFKRYER